ncbi:MAG: Holliday junction resolvase RuvX [Oscillospiraceae bacterium]|nr:Holliday junction resolvase RuvX [Oscillospiraceae bacterium]
MKILGIDLGKARTGVAISDEGERLASPLTTIEERNQEKLIERICKVIKDEKVKKVILGLPKNMDGTEGKNAQNFRKFGKILEEKTGLEIFMQDERGTTITANEYLNEVNINKKKRKKIIDTVSATVILQDYLNSTKNSK